MPTHTQRERKLREIERRAAERTRRAALSPIDRVTEDAARARATGKRRPAPTATQNPPFTAPTPGVGKRRRLLGLEGPFTARGILEKKRKKARERKARK